MLSRPSFDQLPLRKGDPPYSAWGLYGLDDQLGTLNLLTPEVVKEATSEVKTGFRIGLDSPINYLTPPSHGRLPLKHNIFSSNPPTTFHDDSIEMNTQISSQWDGFRHFGYQKEKRFYNGVTAEEISGPNATSTLGMHLLKLAAWCKSGIVGRGILLDYLRWSESQNKPYELISAHVITVDDLKAVADAQKVEIKQGDILIVRSGFNVGYEALNEEQKVEWSKAKPTKWVGLEASVGMARWLWESGFSAAAGDAPGFERFPFGGEFEGEKLSLHEILLGGWGMPIGEMFNVEELSEECARQGRYSFFLTSMPMNVPGLVGSPPHAIAIF
ncbi:hypothetical protein BU16DRAFT_602621 [Lophium mytilinum]|uniref:Cyclase n=1 Tax=Lophium mytilinum TaxID=390894 RepID=A0A6A6R723_9PEZI|nr:hypothetical protein BU16DRAFT_602621 [Lophium mytilinum]